MKQVETAGGVVINKGKVLLVKQGGLTWSLPKGHVEEGEEILQAAEREILEETGITKLVYIKDLGTYKRYRGGIKHNEEDRTILKNIHIMLFYTEQSNLKPGDDDISEAKWVAISDVVGVLTYQKDKDFFESIMDNLPK